ncbi:MAG: hypothetical protein MUP63_00245 [Candidatus Nanohaloarchaeota archaeon QJJ-7]|nr:hypothetical protein [Candidatus Nanohaloarchaeota archaeon QJJ-7]
MEEYLEVWMVFDVMASSEEAARESLENHLEKLEDEKSVKSFSAEVDEITRLENPSPDLDEGYSQVAEVEMEINSFSELVDMVINYGPTSVDVKSPERVDMDLSEIRNSLNSVAQIMHQFLQSGPGGMMVSRPNE